MRRHWPTGGCRAKNKQTNKALNDKINDNEISKLKITCFDYFRIDLANAVCNVSLNVMSPA